MQLSGYQVCIRQDAMMYVVDKIRQDEQTEFPEYKTQNLTAKLAADSLQLRATRRINPALRV